MLAYCLAPPRRLYQPSLPRPDNAVRPGNWRLFNSSYGYAHLIRGNRARYALYPQHDVDIRYVSAKVEFNAEILENPSPSG